MNEYLKCYQWVVVPVGSSTYISVATAQYLIDDQFNYAIKNQWEYSTGLLLYINIEYI